MKSFNASGNTAEAGSSGGVFSGCDPHPYSNLPIPALLQKKKGWSHENGNPYENPTGNPYENHHLHWESLWKSNQLCWLCSSRGSYRPNPVRQVFFFHKWTDHQKTDVQHGFTIIHRCDRVFKRCFWWQFLSDNLLSEVWYNATLYIYIHVYYI